ncbi:MAG: sialidase family protein [Opitutales bacterium]
MKVFIPLFVLLTGFAQGLAAGQDPIVLTAHQLSIATGKPSLVTMSNGTTYLPVWSLSGGTEGQSVAGIVSLPADCAAVKVEIVVTTDEAAAQPGLEDVYRVHLSQMAENTPVTERYLGNPVRTSVPTKAFVTRTIVLESYRRVAPGAPLSVRIQREPKDPANTFSRPAGLALVKVTPLSATPKPFVVEDSPGYNSWPMMQAIGDKLVCVYSRGSGHTIHEDARKAYARTSSNRGRTWTPETVVADTPGFGEVAVGKGLDSKGAALFWIRRVGKEWLQDLYRTTDGVNFKLIATPKLSPAPVQITDIFAMPKVGLMCLWFSGGYAEGNDHAWGTLTSDDDGATWKQTTVESGLSKAQWPTEPSAIHLGDGRILAIGRCEVWGGGTTARAQHQLTSTDSGATWKRAQTNIGEVMGSTPTLVFDAGTGLVSNYYYQRGKGGVLRRRVVDPNFIFDRPLLWPVSEAIAIGSEDPTEAGNINATVVGGTHFLAYYSGHGKNTSVLVTEAPAPSRK